MEIAENITLGLAIFWALWQFLSLRHEIVNGGGVTPPAIPALLLYIVCIVVVLSFHLSPFHLIWLAVVSFFLGIVAIILPPVQALSIAFLGLVTVFLRSNKDNNQQVESSLKNEIKAKQNKSGKKAQGFRS